MKTALRLTSLAIVALVTIFATQAFGQSGAQMVGDKYEEGISKVRSSDLDGAVAAFQAALAAGQAMAGASDAIVQTRYALAYALVQQGKLLDAIPVLDSLVGDAPDNVNGRFLLGVTLVRSFASANTTRGLEVLQQLAKESEGNQKAVATQTAARLAYNASTIEYAAGNSENARDLLGGLTSDLGSAPAASGDENADIRYATGTYLGASGDYAGAQFELGLLITDRKGKYKGYANKNGVTAKQVLGGVYYQAAMDALDLGADGAEDALNMVKELASLEGGESVDVLHVKALALQAKGDTDGLKAAMEAIMDKDSAYHARISGS